MNYDIIFDALGRPVVTYIEATRRFLTPPQDTYDEPES